MALMLVLWLFCFCFRQIICDNLCQDILRRARASSKFGENVYHATHAITVNDLKKFEPTATERNNVPTVNHDRNSPDQILFHAPDIKSDEENLFKTDMIKVLNLILTHINDKNYYEVGYSTLEQIVHTAHMHEFWENVLIDYKKLKKSNLTDDESLCKCVLDIEHNGVMDVFRYAITDAPDTNNTTCDSTLRYDRLDGVRKLKLKNKTEFV